MKQGVKNLIKHIAKMYMAKHSEPRAYEFAKKKVLEMATATSPEALRRVYISNCPVRSISDFERLCMEYHQEILNEPKRRARMSQEMLKYQL